MVPIRIALIAVCVAAFCGGCGEYHGSTDYLIAGNSAFKHGDYKQAEIEYRNAIKLDPNSPTALNNLGVIQNELGKYDDSIATLRHATQLDPNNIIALYTMSQAMAKKGDFDDAISQAKLAIAAPKGNEEVGAHKALAHASLLKAKRDNDKNALKVSMDEYHAILQIDADDADAHAGLGEAIVFGGDKDAGLVELKRAVELNSEDLPTRKLMAGVMIGAGDKAAAAAELKTVLHKDPADDEARKLLDTIGGADNSAIKSGDEKASDGQSAGVKASDEQPADAPNAVPPTRSAR